VALWGPLHGGANEGVLQTLEEIGAVERIPEMLRRAKDKNDPYRLMGFGHRVYKSYDPRAKVLRPLCHEVLGALGRRDDPLLKLAMELERIALEDDYFVSRKLSQCRFLFRHHHPRAGSAAGDVYPDLRRGAHGRLGRPLERDDRRPRNPDRPPAPALFGPGRAPDCADQPASSATAVGRVTPQKRQSTRSGLCHWQGRRPVAKPSGNRLAYPCPLLYPTLRRGHRHGHP